MSAVAVVILAGGDGSRMGGDKPLKMLGGMRLIDRALGIARAWSLEIAVAVREVSQLGPVDAELILDAADVEGPLGGLIAGLRWAREPQLLSIPADMPFLPADLLDGLACAIGDHACAMASSDGHLHPVCALWRSSALDRVDAYLTSGRRSLKGFAEAVGFAEVEWPGESEDAFFNINDEADLAEAERRLAR